MLAAGVPLALAGRACTADVAFGGAFYAIVDAEAAGLSVDPAKLGELKRVGMAIARDVERLVKVVHPTEPGLTGIYGTIFTAPARADGAHLRNVTVFADAEVDRSPCGTGTAAVMAVLDEMGVLGGTRPSCTRASSAPASAAGLPPAPGSAIMPPSSLRSPAAPGSPASTRSWSMATTRCEPGSGSEPRRDWGDDGRPA